MNNTERSQSKAILSHLLQGKELTSMEAIWA